MRTLAIAIHLHDNGNNGYIFAFDAEDKPLPDEATIARQLGIHYEPDNDEGLIVAQVAGVQRFGIPIPADFDKLPVVRS
jgi:hypothetical protein